MRHPLLHSHSEVRKRMVDLIAGGIQIPSSGNLVFVCGGNDEQHLRTKFCLFMQESGLDFQVFQPEYAMDDYFSDSVGSFLDLGAYETLIGDLSHAIVIFPEAAGSFAETGYFALVPELAEKVVLVLDSKYQGKDGFIGMGPARRYSGSSRYSPNLQTNYDEPDFEKIVEKISKFQGFKKKKVISFDGQLDNFEIFCLILKVVDMLGLSTFADLVFVFRSLTKGHPPSEKRLKEITSVLVGAKYLRSVGEFGHYRSSEKIDKLVEIRRGWLETETNLKLEIAQILRSSEPEFADLLDEKFAC